MAGVLRRGAWTGNLPVWEGNARGPDARTPLPAAAAAAWASATASLTDWVDRRGGLVGGGEDGGRTGLLPVGRFPLLGLGGASTGPLIN